MLMRQGKIGKSGSMGSCLHSSATLRFVEEMKVDQEETAWSSPTNSLPSRMAQLQLPVSQGAVLEVAVVGYSLHHQNDS